MRPERLQTIPPYLVQTMLTFSSVWSFCPAGLNVIAILLGNRHTRSVTIPPKCETLTPRQGRAKYKGVVYARVCKPTLLGSSTAMILQT